MGEGVDRSGRLLPQAIERTLAVLREYQALLGEHGVHKVRMVGTSALRDASNRAAFSKPAGELIGTELELLSGQDEAALSFLGATAELSVESAPWLVADIGGGSTELVVGPNHLAPAPLTLAVYGSPNASYNTTPRPVTSWRKRLLGWRPSTTRLMQKYQASGRHRPLSVWQGQFQRLPASTRGS